MDKEVQPCWIEVRPLVSGKFEAGNFAGIFDYLHNTGKPFRFCAVNCPSVKVEGLRCVRFFLQLESAELAERVANVLKSSMDVEVVVGSQPPEKVYGRCVELGLKRHYAVPTCLPGKKPDVNPVDVVVGALAGGESAVEVLALEDRKARLEAINYIAKLTGKSASFVDTLLKTATDIPTAMIFGPPPPSKPKPKELAPVTRERVEAAGWKANQNLLRCELRLYGDAKTVESIRDALPSTPLNSFRIVKRLDAPFINAKKLWKPRGRELKAAALSLLWLIPIALLLYAWLFLHVVDLPRLANIDMFALALTAASAIFLYVMFQRKPPLILSTYELSLIAGLPTAVGRLPIETGTARVTREQFTFGEKPSATAQLPEAPEIGGPEKLKAEEVASVKASVGRPVKIVGILRDPSTGAPLPNTELEVYDPSGNLLFAYFSDGEGKFEITYTPEKPETVRLEIRPKGYTSPSHVFEVSAA
ncbi:MAG: carboxypeptidase-like regulatory domain-containing protein [Candidatus Jordarchaeales archaeon]